MTKEVKIKIRNLFKAFGKKQVLNGVDLDLYKGESLVVIGGSGTGNLRSLWQPAGCGAGPDIVLRRSRHIPPRE